MKIYARKQIGELSYFCSSWENLKSILYYGKIYTSKSKEQTFEGKVIPYVSLGRDITLAPKRNKKKWYVGILLDGDKLSDRYKIEPYSFAYQTFNGKTGKTVKVKNISIYTNGNCYLTVVISGITRKLKITKPIYDAIKQEILQMPESDQEKYRLEYKEGKRKSKYGLKIEEYNFDTKTGGLKLDLNNFKEFSNEFSNNPNIHESEERIWTNSDSIDIHNSILGIIIPESEEQGFWDDEEEVYQDVKDVLNKFYPHWELITY